MTGRERIFTAMNRQEPDRVPCDFGFTPALLEIFKEKTGAENPAEYWNFGEGWAGFKPTATKTDFTRYHPEGIPEGARVGEMGEVDLPGSFFHFTKKQYPLDHETNLSDLQEYPWPVYEDPARYSHLPAEVARLHEEGKYVIGGVGHIWEVAWAITSMPKLMMQFLEDPAQAGFLLDKITAIKLTVTRELVKAGVDSISCGDDVGMQDRLMMSPATWRRWLKPRWAEVWALAKSLNPDVQIFYHSDGKIQEIIPDLIDMGLDILNPVQPECIDPAWAKQEYGRDLAFWGCVGTQTTFPFGTPAEMKATVKHLIETVGQGGGLFLAPTHVLEPEVPWENILAFLEAVEEYGYY
ncbi:MAG TPA: uroporphyrinogen decarboxylase family protein [Armatimonadota bacterium]|jgi:uroporphyrinogen decarboxylase